MSLDRELPNDKEAEAAVLGSIIITNDCIDRVTGLIRPEDFFDSRNKAIFSAMQDLASEGSEIDTITLRGELQKQRQFDAVGGFSYISSLYNGIPDIARVERYAAIVAEKARRRRLIILGNRLMRDGMDDQVRLEELVQDAENTIGVVSGVDTDAKPELVTSLIVDARAEIEERRRSGNFLTGLTTGLTTLDAYTLGWPPGVLTTVGAYTSIGKTAAGLDFAIKCLEANPDKAVAYVALEMTKRLLTYRLMANAAGEKLHWVRSGNLTDTAMERVEAGIDRLRAIGDRFTITDSAFDISQITALARSLRRQGKLDILFVDYLQLVQGVDAASREQEVNKVALGLLRLAKELNIAVVAFAQLNDGIVNREGHRPTLADIRESRAINQHSRTVMLLNRPWVFDKENESLFPCDAVLHIEKNSESMLGDIKLHFNGAFQRFEEAECDQTCDQWSRRQQTFPKEVVNWQ